MPLPQRPNLSTSEPARTPSSRFANPTGQDEDVEYVEVDIDDDSYEEDSEESSQYFEVSEESYNPGSAAPQVESFAEPGVEVDDEEDLDDDLEDSIRGFTQEVLDSVQVLLDNIAGDDSSEVLLNGPDNVMVKRNGQRYQVPNIDFVDADTYHRVINEFILRFTDTNETIGPKSFLIEGQLELPGEEGEPPLLARVHVIAPPVSKFAKVTIAKKSRYQYTIDDIVGRGSMTPNMGEFCRAIARGRLTTVLSGLSGAGKTTLLEAMSHEFDEHDRVVVIEDTPELRIPVADTVYLTATSPRPGVKPEDVVSIEWLVKATNRMRPDRIIVGEIRGGEMSEFLVAANSGADGSMTTVHASSPRLTLDKMRGLAMKAESAKNELSVSREIASTVQIIIQASLIEGKHIITHIEEVSNVIRQETGVIATTTLFEYDRNTGRHVIKARPSESLINFLAQRGVRVDTVWFRGQVAN